MTTSTTKTLRPGLLVGLKTSISGNVTHRRQIIEPEHIEKGRKKSKWETERTIANPVEYEAARTARSKAAALIRSVCAVSDFGLLCPAADADRLEAAVAQARAIAADFNGKSKLTKVSVYVITGRIAADDREAVRAIKGEVRDLLEEMKTGVENLDVKSIRDAAKRARSLGSMLEPDTAVRLRMAIETAREAAKKIVKAGEQAATEVDRAAVRKINEQRAAFIDLDEAKPAAKAKTTGRAIDLAPEMTPAQKAAATRKREKATLSNLDVE